MSLTTGTRLGPYEILSAIGAGGMGEVYKARDTRLDRIVAIKILQGSLASDAQLRERFDREARAISRLKHSHICTLHDIGEQQGTAFLVMEYLEGETLEQRLMKGALPLDQALTVAIQIADALNAAHRHGIVHRDLKPGNVMLTKQGAKLLDFGLARDGGAAAGLANVSMLPTTPPNLTVQGTILGTLQYMAPEQLEGKEADARTDIFALGAVVYEMVTGRKPFEGKTQASLHAAILEREPVALSAAQPSVPRLLDHVVKTCLAKDPEERWQNAGDVARELQWIASTSRTGDLTVQSPGQSPPAALRIGRWLPWTLAAGGLLTATVIVNVPGLRNAGSGSRSLRLSRLQVVTPPNAPLTIDGSVRGLAMTPDGGRVVYVGANGSMLFVRALDQLDVAPLAGLGAPTAPFISPDGQWVGFFDHYVILKKVPLNGGPVVPLTTLNGTARGATWSTDGTIIFATSNSTTGLQRISADGGSVSVLTQPDRAHGELNHVWPELLPGGRTVLFTIAPTAGGLDEAEVAVLDLQTGARKNLFRGSDAHYLPSGHIVYASAGSLRAVPFDLARLAVIGPSVPVVPQVVTTSSGAADAAVAADGTLVYYRANGPLQAGNLVWVDREGHETAIMAPSRAYEYPRIAPDGKRIAIYVLDQQRDIWLWDLAGSELRRVTFDPGSDTYPVWSPDGRRLFFSSERAGPRNLFTQAADGSGSVDRLTETSTVQNASSMSPDGGWLVYTDTSPTTEEDIMQVRVSGTHQIVPLVHTSAVERNGEVSPDGRWLAYESDQSGSFEIYVLPYPNVASGGWQISTGGGTRPLWARTGQELFYLAPDGAVMRVGVEAGPTWANTAPVKLFDWRFLATPVPGRTYDISPDGKRFLMIKQAGDMQSTLSNTMVVIQHWDEDLKRLVAAKPGTE